jgi:hypothetical protein
VKQSPSSTPPVKLTLARANQENCSPCSVPVALLSSDECLPLRELEAVDCFIPKSESVVSLLEKVDYLLSLRFLFKPFDALKAQGAGDGDKDEDAPEPDKPNGISLKNDGIQKRL